MYCEFYQLQERPFNVTPDPKFLYLNARYREAIASLHYGITQRKGFITLIGEAGTGKTTLLKRLLDELDQNTRTVFLFNTNVSFEEILEYMFAEFDLPVHSGKKLYMLQRLNMFLLEELRNGRNVALLIDEAQDLEYSVLEDLRLLSNLETAKEKIIQIVLSGQPELGQKLSNPILRQLRQRISVNCRLLPLSKDEVSEYIRFRLEAAGAPDAKLFTRDAEERIYHFSRGIPRLVNVICDNALVIGYAMGKKRITADIIDEAAADLLPAESASVQPDHNSHSAGGEVAQQSDARQVRRSWWQTLATGGALVAIGFGAWTAGRAVWEAYSVQAPREEQVNHVREIAVAPADGSGAEANIQLPGPQGPGVSAGLPALPVEKHDRGEPAGALTEANTEEAELASAKVEGSVRGSEKDVAPVVEAPQTVPGTTTKMATRLAMLADVPTSSEEVPGEAPRDGSLERTGAEAAQVAAGSVAVVVGAKVSDKEDERADARETYTADRAAMERPSGAVRVLEARAAGGSAPVEDGSKEVGQTVTGVPEIDAKEYKNLVVRPGDSLSGIARARYGQSSYTILDLIKLANPQVRDVDWILPGQTLRLPDLHEGPPVVREAPDRYVLLIFTTPNGQRAQALAQALRRHGFESEIRPTELGTQKRVFRVTVRAGSTRSDALSTGLALQRVLREDAEIARLGQ
ncbi:MAG: AAA family ATPase [Candidatus Binatia bacterium]|nr:AAA family ATPase [Candidatus Binatia bacterium]